MFLVLMVQHKAANTTASVKKKCCQTRNQQPGLDSSAFFVLFSTCRVRYMFQALKATLMHQWNPLALSYLDVFTPTQHFRCLISHMWRASRDLVRYHGRDHTSEFFSFTNPGQKAKLKKKNQPSAGPPIQNQAGCRGHAAEWLVPFKKQRSERNSSLSEGCL